MPGSHITVRQGKLSMSLKDRTSTGIASARAGVSRAPAYRIAGANWTPPWERRRRGPDPLTGILAEGVVPLLELNPALGTEEMRSKRITT